MTVRVTDRWLWIGLGVFIVVAAKGAQYVCIDIMRLTELDPSQHGNQQDQNDNPEDDISVKTLRTLISSPNQNIAEAAKSLAMKRLAFDLTASDAILKDLGSPNEEISRNARQLVKYLLDREEALGVGFQDQYPVHRNGYLTAHGSPRTRHSANLHGELGARIRSLVPGNPGGTGDEAGLDSGFNSTPPRNFHLWHRLRTSLNSYPHQHEDGSGIVSRLDELDEILFHDPSNEAETYRPGTAPYAGWDTIPSQRPIEGEDERQTRRRRREAMVLQNSTAGAL